MKPSDIRTAIANQCGFTPNKAKREIPAEAREQMDREGWATIEEQQAYWKVRDKDLDRIESNTQWFDQQGEKETCVYTEFVEALDQLREANDQQGGNL